ncbi:ATP-binding protein [Nonomuraea sp. MCN248]|uniref:ATP-binding protein n=1 Tax=Nonomuraea corallina TaxID=2989783 RepID=A0ABT4S600_9ACTN|nr:ATP-binding protein [Nonomuraea corallina]MDA0632478.1 ATP-binding protein [Nonomuraea corallina]
MSARLLQLRLTSFKTFRDALLPLGDMTLLIGRNSSGKSNALDGLEVLSRLAEGGDIVDSLDSRRVDEGPLRGGIAGCPPHGADIFQLGCQVLNPERVGNAYFLIEFDVEIRVRPEPQIISESLRAFSGKLRNTRDPSGRALHTLLHAERSSGSSGSIEATWYNGRRGRDPKAAFRSSRLLTAQLPLRLELTTETERHVATAAQDVLHTLRGVFHLDPVPHLMRQYVPSRDIRLRRTAENISAVVEHLKQVDPTAYERLLRHAQALVDHDISGIELIRSELDDLMLALREDGATTPAREMSDGLLRFIAIATALLRQGMDLDLSRRDPADGGATPLLVIEELENGLHPSQASQLLRLVKSATEERTAQIVFTTHSPALLSALSQEDHRSVVVTTRDRATGLSHLTKLPDLPGYPSLMAQGDLGAIITSGLLEQGPPENDHTEFDRLMGLG